MVRIAHFETSPLSMLNETDTSLYNYNYVWGVAKRQGSGFWYRDRWFESSHPSHTYLWLCKAC